MPHEGQQKFQGEGGVSKRRQFPRESGFAYRSLFPGSLSKIGELIINSSFSVEKAVNYSTVTSVSKQVLLLALIMFYLRSAKCFLQ